MEFPRESPTLTYESQTLTLLGSTQLNRLERTHAKMLRLFTSFSALWARLQDAKLNSTCDGPQSHARRSEMNRIGLSCIPEIALRCFVAVLSGASSSRWGGTGHAANLRNCDSRKPSNSPMTTRYSVRTQRRTLNSILQLQVTFGHRH
jgi:hypothetical protein